MPGCVICDTRYLLQRNWNNKNVHQICKYDCDKPFSEIKSSNVNFNDRVKQKLFTLHSNVYVFYLSHPKQRIRTQVYLRIKQKNVLGSGAGIATHSYINIYKDFLVREYSHCGASKVYSTEHVRTCTQRVWVRNNNRTAMTIGLHGQKQEKSCKWRQQQWTTKPIWPIQRAHCHYVTNLIAHMNARRTP